MIPRYLLFVFLLLTFHQNIEASRSVTLSLTDTISPTKKSSARLVDSTQKRGAFASAAPKKAALLSAVIPGAGQLYNKKGIWWKLPLCYGAYGYTIYNHLQARRTYFFYKDIYELRVKNQPLPSTLYGQRVPEFYNTTDISAFFRQKNNYRNNYERSFLWIGAAHLFAVADAFVTAHLKSFDVSDNLTMTIKPTFDVMSMRPAMGIAFRIK